MDWLTIFVVVAVNSVTIIFQHHRHVTIFSSATHADARGHTWNFAEVSEVPGLVTSLQGGVILDVAVFTH